MKDIAVRAACVAIGCAVALSLDGLARVLDFVSELGSDPEHDRRPLQREEAWWDIP